MEDIDRKQMEMAFDRLYSLYKSGKIRPAEARELARLNAVLTPIWQADAVDASTPKEYSFGDVGSSMGNENLQAAGDIWSNAGNVTRNMLPESAKQYFNSPVGQAISYIPDMALGGAAGLMGMLEKGVGYGAEVADAAARGVSSAVGYDWPYAPRTSAQMLANDIMAGIYVAGVGPEARLLDLASGAAKSAKTAGAVKRRNY